MYDLTAVEARCRKPRCQQGWFLLETLRENLFQEPLLASGGCQQSLAFLGLEMHPSHLCLSLHMPSLCVPVSSRGLLQGHQPLDLGPTLIQYDLILANYICKDPICK